MVLDTEFITTVVKEGMPALEVLAGSKAAALLIERVSSVVGWYMQPKTIIRNARADAAASIIKAEAEQEIKLSDQRIAARIIHEEKKSQQNIDNVLLGSLHSVTEEANPAGIDEDWLTNFFDKCRKISNSDMQQIWSQILAGEANSPGNFSIRTINFLATLSQKEARDFLRVCAHLWTFPGGKLLTIIRYEGQLNPTDGQSVREIGYDCLQHLADIGIIEFNPHDSGFIIPVPAAIIAYNGSPIFLQKPKHIVQNTIQIGNVMLTQMGRELASICKPAYDYCIMEDDMEWWMRHGYQVTCQVPIAKPDPLLTNKI